MIGMLDTVGERVSIAAELGWVHELVVEGAAGELRDADRRSRASVHVRVESSSSAFDTHGWEVLTRGAWRRNGEAVVENICTAGFDLHLRCSPLGAEFTYRWRPPARDRAAARILRSRFHLLARSVLLQYPAFWWAGTRGRVPLHASACVAAGSTPMLTAPSGVGRSTVVLGEIAAGGRVTGDNLSAGDGKALWGLVEPLRVEGGSGRRMPHGRSEMPMPNRLPSVVPDALVVLVRGDSERASLVRCDSDAARRSLVASTYMAGELRRYWPFAATLSAATGVGPAHPSVADVASTFAQSLPCFLLTLGRTPGAILTELLSTVEVAA
jgi:hypothetical protein